MDEQALKKEYDENGFLVVRNFLNAEELAELTDALDRYIAETVPTLDPGDAFYENREDKSTLKQLQL